MRLRKHLLFSLKIKIDLIRFSYIKRFWGFQNATLLFMSFHKMSVIPVLVANGAIVGDNCDIETGLTFHNCSSFNNLSIGNNCHIGKNCFFDLQDKVKIGDNVTISMQATFITHIDLGKSSLKKDFPSKHMPIRINNDVYIGAGAIILMGVSIEARSFIAAGAVVNGIVENDVMVGGVPAKVIRKLG